MKQLVSAALKFHFLVIFAAILVIAAGIYAVTELPIDAVPDITPNQVLVLTRAPSLSPVEVEQFLTFPSKWR